MCFCGIVLFGVGLCIVCCFVLFGVGVYCVVVLCCGVLRCLVLNFVELACDF